jgi:esterase/lipase superfamily enzyme
LEESAIMFIITNRRVHETKSDLDAFGSEPSEKGPNELRLAEAERSGGSWRIKILPDKVSAADAAAASLAPRLDASGNPLPFVASQLVARRLIDRLEKLDRNLVLFVHGYNNDLKAVLNRAQAFEDAYKVEVLVFTWPANGGGIVGAASYKSDKRDAIASIGGFSRVLLKLADYLDDFNRERIKKIEEEATRRFPDDDEKWNRFFATAAEKGCPFTVNLVLHSMGNYLFKHVMQSSVLRVDRLTFDNIILVAADVNNDGHADWVDLIQCRNRVYITINEDDVALRASRVKAGEEQRARLGHYPYNLYAQRAVYVDFTGATHVGDSHAYFEGKPLNNRAVKKFFQQAFGGERAEEALEYQTARRLYSCR